MQIQQLIGTGKRESNQDFICIDRLESGASFFLIADGMGGYAIKEEKSLDKYKHIVTRSLSGKPFESSIGYQSLQFSEEDLFIICSDGVHNTISVEQILVYGSQENGLLELEDIFLKETQDNYSVITIGF